MKTLLSVMIALIPAFANAQHVSSMDVVNFWQTADSVRSTADTAKQLYFIRSLYIAKADEGLQAFLKNKDNPEQKWLALINSGQVYTEAIKSGAFALASETSKLENYIVRLEKLYPELKPARTYLLIGFGQQGGTVRGNMSLLFPEVILKDSSASGDQFIRMGIHEYVHTQQTRPDFQKINVLASSLREGVCELIAEIVTNISSNAAYMSYGKVHETAVWKKFKQEMLSKQNDNWVSTGRNPALPAPDLGYFIGYRICKSYYEKAKNKHIAIKEMIEMDYSDESKVTGFLARSGYGTF